MPDLTQPYATFNDNNNLTAPAPSQGNGFTDNSLAPTELINFETQRLDIRRNTREGLAQIEFDRGLNNLRRTRSIRDLTRTFNRRREGISEEFAARGLLRSGLQRTARNRLQESFDLGRDSIEFEAGILDDQFRRGASRLEREQRFGLSNIDLLEQALRSERASQVEIS